MPCQNKAFNLQDASARSPNIYLCDRIKLLRACIFVYPHTPILYTHLDVFFLVFWSTAKSASIFIMTLDQ